MIQLIEKEIKETEELLVKTEEEISKVNGQIKDIQGYRQKLITNHVALEGKLSGLNKILSEFSKYSAEEIK